MSLSADLNIWLLNNTALIPYYNSHNYNNNYYLLCQFLTVYYHFSCLYGCLPHHKYRWSGFLVRLYILQVYSAYYIHISGHHCHLQWLSDFHLYHNNKLFLHCHTLHLIIGYLHCSYIRLHSLLLQYQNQQFPYLSHCFHNLFLFRK